MKQNPIKKMDTSLFDHRTRPYFARVTCNESDATVPLLSSICSTFETRNLVTL